MLPHAGTAGIAVAGIIGRAADGAAAGADGTRVEAKLGIFEPETSVGCSLGETTASALVPGVDMRVERSNVSRGTFEDEKFRNADAGGLARAASDGQTDRQLI